MRKIGTILSKGLIHFLVFNFVVSPLFPAFPFFAHALPSVPEYDFTVEHLNIPSEVNPSENYNFDIELANTGSTMWYGLDSPEDSQIQLSYKISNGIELFDGVKSDLISSVNSQDLIPNNLTDPNQTLNINFPSNPGDYSLEVYLYNLDTMEYIPSLNPIVYSFEVVELDITPPVGSIVLNDGNAYTLDNSLQIELSATDESEPIYYRYGINSDLTVVEYELFEPQMGNVYTVNDVFGDGYGTYNYFVQFKDAEDNESVVYSDSIDYIEYFIDGFVKVDDGYTVVTSNGNEVLDENVFISISANGNNVISEFSISFSEGLVGNEWYEFSTPSNTVSQIVPEQLPTQSGEYTIYVQVRDEFGNLSEIFSDSVYLNYRNIETTIESNIDKILFAGTSDWNFIIKNLGEDIAYNAGLELKLPKGFEFVKSYTYENGIKVDGGFSPSLITTDSEGRQILEYKSIADLLPAESTNVYLTIQAGGREDGYRLGDIVTIHSTAKLYKADDFANAFETIGLFSAELIPFELTLNSADYDTGKVLVSDELSNKITLRTNPEIESEEYIEDDEDLVPNPFEIRFSLANGLKYIADSYQLLNYKGDSEDNVELFVNDVEGAGGLLRWVFKEKVGTDYYLEPLLILFNTVVPKFNEDTQEYIEHNEKFENNVEAEGIYSNVEDEEVIDTTVYEDKDSDNLIAKYFKVTKHGVSHNTDVGEIITYTINIQTSIDYNLSGIEITDIIPDGVSYVGNIQTSKDLALVLFNLYNDPETGKSILKWRITEAEGVVAGSEFEFSYQTVVDENYEVKSLENEDSRLFSADILSSSVTLRGLWSDIDESVVRSDIDTDSDWTHSHLPYVNYTSGIKRSTESNYAKSVEAKIGDVVDVYSKIEFPANTPTNNFSYRIYLPIGTELDGDFDVDFVGDSQNAPSLDPIEGGYVVNLGKVEPLSVLNISYSLNVLDDPNLKLAVQTRNMFRGNYSNIDNSTQEYRDELLLNIIEPKVVLTKSVVSGYLARGEEAQIKVEISNIGSDEAFGIVFQDLIPQNTELIIGTDYIVDDYVSYSFADNSFTSNSFDLAAGQSVVLMYSVVSDGDLIFGDDMTSESIVGTYSNRSVEDLLVRRNYDEKTYAHNWKAKEPLLVTNIFRVGFEGLSEIPIGRGDSATLKYQVRVVGNSPVYDTDIQINLGELFGLDSEIEKTCNIISSNGVEELIGSEVDGILNIDNIDFENPNNIFECMLTVNSPDNTLFGQEYDVSIVATGYDALGVEIRKDGSIENPIDIDNDDLTSKTVVTTKLDISNPTGEISFWDGESEISFTQSDLATAKYTAQDLPNPFGINGRIVGVRFFDEGGSWTTLSELPELSNEEKSVFELTGDWNSWDGSEISRLVNIPNEGSNTYYMEIVDLYGNTQIVESTIIKDTNAPTFTFLNISPFEGDLSNPLNTGVLSNYLNFYSNDDNTQGTPSGMGYYSYSYDGTTWSEWAEMVDDINSVVITYPASEDGTIFNIRLKVKDLAGNQVDASLFDEIVYYKHDIQILTTLNDEEEYTNNAVVDYSIEYIVESPNEIFEVRYGYSVENLESSEWEPYNEPIGTKQLGQAWLDGQKNLCIQVRDIAANESNISCASIRLDTQPPVGLVLMPETTISRRVELSMDIQDPLAQDETPGSGQIQIRYSIIGEDCELLIDETEKLECEQSWTEWENNSASKEWLFDNSIGEHILYIQFRDGAGNISGVQSYSTLLNPTSSGSIKLGGDVISATGGIVINNNELFTNTRHVMLNMDLDMDTTNCNNCEGPLLMRFIQMEGEELPPNPPIVNSPDDNLGGWTYWQEYYNPKEWNLDENQDEFPNFGYKTVYVQFMLPNAQLTDLYFDSIIYAPHYAVEYSEVSNVDILNNEYSLNNVKDEYLAQDNFNLVLNAKNIGSFTWPKAGDNPVHISYKWIRTGGSMPEGWTESTIPKVLRGNAAILPTNINWNQQTGEVSLSVDTPVIPGEYELVIDTVHEGKAWFGDFGNETPTFDIRIIENPDKPTPIPEFGNVLGENSMGAEVPVPYEWEADGWGHNCADTWGSNHNRLCYVQGTWQVNSDTGYHEICAPYGGYYQHQIVVDGRKFNFCGSNKPYWDSFLGQQMTVKVQFWADGNHYSILGRTPTRVFWKSEYFSSDNDSRFLNPIVVNKSTATQPYEFTIQPKFRNTGTGVWKRGEVYLVSVNRSGQEVVSPFKGSDWYSSSRMYLDSNNSGWGQWTKAPFTGKIYIPENIPWGIHEQCFQVRKDGTSFERSDVWCIKLDIQMTYQDRRNYYCPQPHPVFKEMNESSNVIGYLNQNDGFVIKGDFGDWSLLYYPSGENEQGWVKNNLECFGESEKIENIIPKPEFKIDEPPTGDTGIVQTIGGIDVKAGPGEMFATIGTLKEGDKVQVLARAYIEGEKYGGWLLIRLEDGTEGWVPIGTIQHTNEPKNIEVELKPDLIRAHVCGGSRITAYTMPGVKTSIAGYLEPGQNIPIIQKWNGWYQVYLNKNGKNGWIEGIGGLCDGYSYPKENFCGSGEVGYPYEKQAGYDEEWGAFRSAKRKHHTGIDLLMPYGTPIIASVSGQVIGVSYSGTPGGNPKFIMTYNSELNIKVGYWHLSGISDTVADGWVEKGEVIGFTGNTGDVYCSSGGDWIRPPSGSTCGSHLHFDIYSNNINDYVNPWSYLTSSGKNSTACENPNEFDQTSYKSRVERLIAEMEAKWGSAASPMNDWRGELHQWHQEDGCGVWVKDYEYMRADGLSFGSSGNNSAGVAIYNPKTNKLYFVGGGIWEKYLELGGPCKSGLGLPKDTSGFYSERPAGISNSSRDNGVTSAAYQRFDNGSIYWHWNSNKNMAISASVQGEISDLYEEAGGTWSRYGFPLAEEANGCQKFEFGSICTKNEPKDDFRRFIKNLIILEDYYTREEIVAILFGIYEPEGWWNFAAPETEQYRPKGGQLVIPRCSGEKCSEKVKSSLEDLLTMANCDIQLGCLNITANRFVPHVGKSPINIGHVFAGLSEEYYKTTDLKMEWGSWFMGGFTKLDSRARTYIGDLGGVLWSAVGSNEFKNATTEEERFQILNHRYFEGLIDKYDLDADVDSYMLRHILRSQDVKLSEAFEIYYAENSPYYSSRYTTFGENELNIRFDMANNMWYPDMNKAEEINKHVISFGFAIRANDPDNCNVLGVDQPYCQLLFGSGGDDTAAINYYSSFVTEGLYNAVVCNAKEESGFGICEEQR